MAVLRSDDVKSHDCDSATASQRIEWGCDGPAPAGCEWDFEGIRIDRCVQHYVRRSAPWLNFVFEIHSWREKGILPYPGSLVDQPNVIVEAMNYMDYLIGIKYAPKTKYGK